MVKTVLSVTHQGLRDWMIQRLSAIYMAIFVLGFAVYFGRHTDLSFAEWHTLFTANWLKVATILFVLSLLFHTWIGVWTIFTDYVKCVVVRGILNVLVLFVLSASFIWSILILWSV